MSRAPLLWAGPAAEASVPAPSDPVDPCPHQYASRALSLCRLSAQSQTLALAFPFQLPFLSLHSEHLLSPSSVFKEKRKIYPIRPTGRSVEC